MPAWPELLYVLSQRDLQITWLDPIIRTELGSAAAVNVETGTFFVPLDRAMLLLHCALRINPGAGLNVVSAFLNVHAPFGPGVPLLHIGRLAADVSEGVHASPQVVLPPNWEIEGKATFSGTLNANVVEISIAGILIPPGNIQRV